MNNTPFVTPAEASQVETPFHAFRRTMGTTEHMMLIEFFIPREVVVPEHSHVHDQVGYVVRGVIEVTINGVMQVCHPGDSYAVESNVVHTARAQVDTLVIEVFTPPREEYRNG